MALSLSTTVKKSVVNQVITVLAGTYGTAGTASLYLYTGSQPANADATTSGVLLGTISGISWAECTGGTSALTNTFSGTSSTAGTIGWGRFERIGADGTFRMDGNVGTGATNVFVINNAIFATAGAQVSLLTGPLYTS